MPNPDDLLTSAEVAEILGVQPNTIKVWRRRRRGPVFESGVNKVRYRRDVVEEFARGYLGRKA